MIVASAEAITRHTARGWWGAETFGDHLRRHVGERPRDEAVVDPPNRAEVVGGSPMRLTWADLGQRVEAMQAGLAAAGIGPDDVIVAQLANTWEFAALYLACAEMRIVVAPIPAQYREHEITHVVRTTRAKAVVVPARIGKADHLALARHAVQELPARAIDVADLFSVKSAGAFVRPAVSAHDVLCICWTSGSEGLPKGVARSHAQLLAMRPLVDELVRPGPGDRLLSARPFVTIGSMTATFVPWMVSGGALVNHQPLSTPIMARQIEEENIDFMGCAPAMLVKLLEEPALKDALRLGRIRAMTCGSAPLPAHLMRLMRERFGIEVANVFGSTEGTFLLSGPGDMGDLDLRATLFPRFGDARLRWNCRLAAAMETRLVDPATGEVIDEAGRPGELRHRGALALDGYFNAPDLTAAAFDADGYFRTGDLFEIAGDARQYLRFVGRLKDIVVRGGMNISAQEVEMLALEHPAVADVAAVGVPDRVLGERLCLAVVPRDAAPSLDEINRYLRDEKRIAVFKLPERMLTLAELPRTPVGKVDKNALRRMALGSN